MDKFLQLIIYWILLIETPSIDADTCPANRALDRPTTQQSTAAGGTSNRAVDGSTSGDYFGGASCTHTNEANGSPGGRVWWQVDLENLYTIDIVIVYNRDIVTERLAGAAIAISTEGVTVVGAAQLDSLPKCGKIVWPDTRRIVTKCATPLLGRYVVIYLDHLEKKTLTLCEVQVFSSYDDGLEDGNLAFGKPTAQLEGSVSGIAVDGEYSPQCLSVSSSVFSWWEVDLCFRSTIGVVVIYCLGNCQAKHLTGAVIVVSEGTVDPKTLSALSGKPECGRAPEEDVIQKNGGKVSVYCPSKLQGKRLFIYREGQLEFCEVEIYERATHYYMPMDVIESGLVIGSIDATIAGQMKLTDEAIKGKALDVGNSGYVSFGNLRDECFGNPEKCPSGFTMAFWLKPQNNTKKTAEYYLSSGGQTGSSFGIALLRDKRFYRFMMTTHVDIFDHYFRLTSQAWNHIAVVLTAGHELRIHVNGTLVVQDETPSGRSPFLVSSSLNSFVLGRPNNNLGTTYAGVFLLDELHFWTEVKEARFLVALYKDELKQAPDITNWVLQLPYNYISMDEEGEEEIQDDVSYDMVGLVTTTNEAIWGNAFKFTGGYLDFGNLRSVCMGNPELCPLGFTFAFWFYPDHLAKKKEFYFSSGGETHLNIGVAMRRRNSKFYIHVRTHAHKVSGVMQLDNKTWHHIGLTWSMDEGLGIYLNGTLNGTKTPNVLRDDALVRSKDNQFVIGREIELLEDTAGRFSMDEFYFWPCIKDPRDLQRLIQDGLVKGSGFGSDNLIGECRVPVNSGHLASQSVCLWKTVAPTPWWHIDMLEEFLISHIALTTGNLTAGGIWNLQVATSQLLPMNSSFSNYTICYHQSDIFGPSSRFLIPCQSATWARYLMLYLNDTIYSKLEICNLEIYGRIGNLAFSQPTENGRSGSYEGIWCPSGKVVDGNVITRSVIVSPYWWAVDLGATVLVTKTFLNITWRGSAQLHVYILPGTLSSEGRDSTTLHYTRNGGFPYLETRYCTWPMPGRTVRIDFSSVRYGQVHLSVVEVFSIIPKVRTPNIALNKPTYQSSTVGNWTSGHAVDGMAGSVFAKTQNEPSWWAVDLIKSYIIHQVTIYHYSEVTQDIEVIVGDVLNFKHSGISSYTLCGKYSTVPGFSWSDVTCKSENRGRFVGIWNQVRELTISEVEVFPEENQLYDMNVANHQPTRQISNANYLSLSHLAVDGIPNARQEMASCATTQKEDVAWWTVDLQHRFLITRLAIYIPQHDESAQSLNGSIIALSNTSLLDVDTSVLPSLPTCNGQPLIFSTDDKGRRTEIICEMPTKARQVIIYNINQSLVLCEVEVFVSNPHFYYPMWDEHPLVSGQPTFSLYGINSNVAGAKGGRAICLDNGQGYMYIDNITDDCFGNPQHCPLGFTLAFWVKPLPGPTIPSEYYLHTGGEDYQSNGISITRNTATQIIHVVVAIPGYKWKSQGPKLGIYSWYHVMVRWEPREGLSLFVNSVSYASTKHLYRPLGDPEEADTFYIGRGSSYPETNFINACFDDLHFWAEAKDNKSIMVFEGDAYDPGPSNNVAINSTYTATSYAAIGASSGNTGTYQLGQCINASSDGVPWVAFSIEDNLKVLYVAFTMQFNETSHRQDLVVSSAQSLHTDFFPWDIDVCSYIPGYIQDKTRLLITCESAGPVKYIVIHQLSVRAITVCDMEIYLKKVISTKNIAPHHDVYRSSGLVDSYTLLVDGRTRLGDNHETRTRYPASHWLQIDLIEPFKIEHVAIVVDTDLGDDQTGTQILVGNNSLTTVGTVGCGLLPFMVGYHRHVVACDPVSTGQYVTLYIRSGQLEIKEIEVFPQEFPKTYMANVALYKKPLNQRAIPDDGHRAVDGNPDRFMGSSSCTILPRDKDGLSWWAVDLGLMYQVSSLQVVRADDPRYHSMPSVWFAVATHLDNTTLEYFQSLPVCRTSTNINGVGLSSWYACIRSMRGRYVVLYQTHTQPLTLCEVEVYAQVSQYHYPMDSISNGTLGGDHTGSVNGTVTLLEDGVKGKAIQLDAGAHIDLANHELECIADIDLCLDGFTVMFWMKTLSEETDTEILFSFIGNMSRGIMIKRIVPSRIYELIIISKEQLWNSSRIKILPNNWTHIAITWSLEGGVITYTDGVESYIQKDPLNFNQEVFETVNELSLGNEQNTGILQLDDFHFWAEIKTRRFIGVFVEEYLSKGREITKGRRITIHGGGNPVHFFDRSLETCVLQNTHYYLQIDLGETFLIDYIALVTTADYAGHLEDIFIRAGPQWDYRLAPFCDALWGIQGAGRHLYLCRQTEDVQVIWIRPAGPGQLRTCQMEIYLRQDNIALRGETAMSSIEIVDTGEHPMSDRAVDGRISQSLSAATLVENNPWWAVDLRVEVQVKTIDLYLADPIARIRTLVGNGLVSTLQSSDLDGFQLCKEDSLSTNDLHHVLNCQTCEVIKKKLVVIQAMGNVRLNISEVKIYQEESRSHYRSRQFTNMIIANVSEQTSYVIEMTMPYRSYLSVGNSTSLYHLYYFFRGRYDISLYRAGRRVAVASFSQSRSTLWISWENYDFKFGLGPVPNKDVVLSYRDPTPLTGIAHVYLYGYAHYSIRWETVDVSLDAEGPEIPPVPNIQRSSEGNLTVVLNLTCGRPFSCANTGEEWEPYVIFDLGNTKDTGAVKIRSHSPRVTENVGVAGVDRMTSRPHSQMRCNRKLVELLPNVETLINCDCVISGRYVGVLVEEKVSSLFICEIEIIWENTRDHTNLALGKPGYYFTQVINWPGFTDGLCHVFVLNYRYGNAHKNSWVVVDLGTENIVNMVIITLEFYSTGTRGWVLYIRVGSDFDSGTGIDRLDLCVKTKRSWENYQSVSLTCTCPLRGRYVSADFQNRLALTRYVSEIQVYNESTSTDIKPVNLLLGNKSRVWTDSEDVESLHDGFCNSDLLLGGCRSSSNFTIDLESYQLLHGLRLTLGQTLKYDGIVIDIYADFGDHRVTCKQLRQPLIGLKLDVVCDCPFYTSTLTIRSPEHLPLVLCEIQAYDSCLQEPLVMDMNYYTVPNYVLTDLDLSNRTSLMFRARGYQVYLNLYEDETITNKYYAVFLSVNTIYLYTHGPYSYFRSSYPLLRDQDTDYWLSWENGLLTLGHGRVLGRWLLGSRQDTATPLLHVRRLKVQVRSSYDAHVRFESGIPRYNKDRTNWALNLPMNTSQMDTTRVLTDNECSTKLDRCKTVVQQENPWFSIDLGQTKTIFRLLVTVGEGPFDFNISVTEELNSPPDLPLQESICKHVRGASPLNFEVLCDWPLRGRYVYIYSLLEGAHNMTLCEVKVHDDKYLKDNNFYVQDGICAETDYANLTDGHVQYDAYDYCTSLCVNSSTCQAYITMEIYQTYGMCWLINTSCSHTYIPQEYSLYMESTFRTYRKIGGCNHDPKTGMAGVWDYGDFVVRPCDFGYRRAQNVSLFDFQAICSYNNSWVDFGGCKAMECPLVLLNNTNLLNISGSYDISIYIECIPGFHVRPGMETFRVNCSENGTWIGIEQCTAKSCMIAHPENTTQGELNGTTNHVIQVDCVTGYATSFNDSRNITIESVETIDLITNYNSTCSTNGTWSPILPCSLRPCLFRPERAHEIMAGYYGDNTTVNCKEGFIVPPHFLPNTTDGLSYSYNATCLDSGHWSIEASCDEKRCAEITLDNATPLVINANYNSSLLVTCNHGHQVPDGGPGFNATCLSIGLWEGIETCNLYLHDGNSQLQDCGLPVPPKDIEYKACHDVAINIRTAKPCFRKGPANVTFVGNLTGVYGDEMRIDCLYGYIPLEGENLTALRPQDIEIPEERFYNTSCHANQSWAPVMDCLAVPCYVSGIENASYTELSGWLDDTLEVVCDDGYSTSERGHLYITPFNYGRDAISAYFTTCLINGSWSKTFSCARTPCFKSDPANTESGDLVAYYGDQFEVKCQHGYVTSLPHGPNVITSLNYKNKTLTITSYNTSCNANGTWDFSHGCRRIPCRDPGPLLTTSEGEWLDGVYEDTATVYCIEGHVTHLLGPEYINFTNYRKVAISEYDIICLAEGMWGPQINCTATPCYADAPENTTTVNITGHFPDEVIVYCIEGFNTKDKEKVYVSRCTAGGNWDKLEECEPVKCSQITFENSDSGTFEGEYPFMKTVNCDYGYESHGLVKQFDVACTKDGTWSNGERVCEPVTCNRTTVVNSNAIDVFLERGQSRNYSCNHGHRTLALERHFIMRCNSQKKWIETFACQRMTCKAMTVYASNVSNVVGEYGDLLRIKCVFGYRLNTSESITVMRCKDSGNWNVSVKCLKIECREEPPLLTRLNHMVGEYQGTILVRCRPGCHLGDNNDNYISHCGGNGVWTPKRDCQYRMCPEVSGAAYNVETTLPSKQVSESFNVLCARGHHMPNQPGVRTQTATCNALGHWSVTKCVSIRCGSINASNCNTTEGIKDKFGDSHTLVCKPGYKLSNGKLIYHTTCLENGSWSLVLNCTEIFCPSLTLPNTNVSNVTALPQTLIRAQCVPGYNAKDQPGFEVTCLENGTWSEVKFRCERGVCPKLTVAHSNGKNVTGFYGDRHLINCTEGYELQKGEKKTWVECLTTLKWNWTGHCNPKTCPDPVHGKSVVIITKKSKAEWSFKDEVEFVCSKGYEGPIGTSSSQCLMNGTWTTIPRCVRQCDPLPKIVNGWKKFNTSVLGAVEWCLCNEGFTLVGNATLKCILGKWNDTIPICKPTPVDGYPELWTDWTSCSTTCSNGFRNRSRTILPPKHGGKPWTGDTKQSEECNMAKCPVNCLVEEWSEWTNCSKKCGKGFATSIRRIIIQDENGGEACPILANATICRGTSCKAAASGRTGEEEEEEKTVLSDFTDADRDNAHIAVPIATCFIVVSAGCIFFLDVAGIFMSKELLAAKAAASATMQAFKP